VNKRFIAWGFWMVFYYLRDNGRLWNHKRVYRVWKQEEPRLRLPPKRAVIRRSYQELLPPEGINDGWAMDFLSDWVVGPNEQLRFIQPGKPSQNGLIERLNKTLRTECLNLAWFKDLIELNEQIQAWSCTYNQERPHQNLGYKSPDQYEVLKQKFYFSVVAA
jgi:transposase InsO family protein